jgi:hypothetical protein
MVFMSRMNSKNNHNRTLVEDCLKLDLAWIMRLGPVRDGQSGTGQVNWTKDGEPTGSAQFRLILTNEDVAQLILQFGDTKQVIRLTSVKQHFGGRRWWLLCPVTGAKARNLYRPEGGDCFASRKVWGLVYSMENLSRSNRTFEQLNRLQKKLGFNVSLDGQVVRPKGMWERSFARHMARLEQRDLACMEQIIAYIK